MVVIKYPRVRTSHLSVYLHVSLWLSVGGMQQPLPDLQPSTFNSQPAISFLFSCFCKFLAEQQRKTNKTEGKYVHRCSMTWHQSMHIVRVCYTYDVLVCSVILGNPPKPKPMKHETGFGWFFINYCPIPGYRGRIDVVWLIDGTMRVLYCVWRHSVGYIYISHIRILWMPHARDLLFVKLSGQVEVVGWHIILHRSSRRQRKQQTSKKPRFLTGWLCWDSCVLGRIVLDSS